MASRDSGVVLDPVTEQRLGPLVIDCAGATGGKAGFRSLLVAVGAMVVGVALVPVSTLTRFPPLGIFGLALFVVGVGWIFVSARTVLRGAQHYYLHMGGLVYARKGRPTAATWPEIASLTRRRAAKPAPAVGITRESVMGYDLTTRTGTRLRLHVTDVWGEQPPRFCARLEELATRAGVTVTG